MRDDEAGHQERDSHADNADTAPLVVRYLCHERRRNMLALAAWLAAGALLVTLFVLAWMLLPLAAGLFSFSATVIPVAWTGVAAAAHVTRARETTRWLSSIRSTGVTSWAQKAAPLSGIKPVTPAEAITAALAREATGD